MTTVTGYTDIAALRALIRDQILRLYPVVSACRNAFVPSIVVKTEHSAANTSSLDEDTMYTAVAGVGYVTNEQKYSCKPFIEGAPKDTRRGALGALLDACGELAAMHTSALLITEESEGVKTLPAAGGKFRNVQVTDETADGEEMSAEVANSYT